MKADFRYNPKMLCTTLHFLQAACNIKGTKTPLRTFSVPPRAVSLTVWSRSGSQGYLNIMRRIGTPTAGKLAVHVVRLLETHILIRCYHFFDEKRLTFGRGAHYAFLQRGYEKEDRTCYWALKLPNLCYSGNLVRVRQTRSVART